MKILLGTPGWGWRVFGIAGARARWFLGFSMASTEVTELEQQNADLREQNTGLDQRCAELEQLNDQLQRLATRYEFCRNAGAWEAESVLDTLSPEEFDALVDQEIAARAAELASKGRPT